jgi:hypothetical protein
LGFGNGVCSGNRNKIVSKKEERKEERGEKESK